MSRAHIQRHMEITRNVRARYLPGGMRHAICGDAKAREIVAMFDAYLAEAAKAHAEMPEVEQPEIETSRAAAGEVQRW